jgi:hypothetical protein
MLTYVDLIRQNLTLRSHYMLIRINVLQPIIGDQARVLSHIHSITAANFIHHMYRSKPGAVDSIQYYGLRITRITWNMQVQYVHVSGNWGLDRHVPWEALGASKLIVWSHGIYIYIYQSCSKRGNRKENKVYRRTQTKPFKHVWETHSPKYHRLEKDAPHKIRSKMP